MSTIKVVSDYVPERGKGIITAGKVYELTLLAEGHRGGDIIMDDGQTTFISIDESAYLCGRSWRIVE